MKRRRAIERTGVIPLRAIALFLFLPLVGCRDADLPTPPSPATSLRFLSGDRFTYDVWNTTVWGVTQDTSRRTVEWTVISAGPGGTGLIRIARIHTPLPPRTAWQDTIQLHLSPDGTLSQEGFLAELVARREQRTIPARWDTLLETGREFWRVGAVDSAGLIIVTGAFAPPDYVNALINGSPLAFPARRAQLRSDELDYDLWYCASPPSLPRWEERPDPYLGIRGSYGVLRDAVLAPGARAGAYFSRSSQSRTW